MTVGSFVFMLHSHLPFYRKAGIWPFGEENLYEAAKTAIEKAYPDLLSTLRQKYPDLNETEVRVCLMSCTDLSNTEIADLLGLSLNTVNKSRSNLRKKLSLETNSLKEQLRNTLTKSKS